MALKIRDLNMERVDAHIPLGKKVTPSSMATPLSTGVYKEVQRFKVKFR